MPDTFLKGVFEKTFNYICTLKQDLMCFWVYMCWCVPHCSGVCIGVCVYQVSSFRGQFDGV